MKIEIDVSNVENFDEADFVSITGIFKGATGFLIMTELGDKCGIMSHRMTGGALASSFAQILKIRPDVKLALAGMGVIKLGRVEHAMLSANIMLHAMFGRGGKNEEDADVEKWK